MNKQDAEHKIHKPELLSPAGSREALIGAINAGCDAVYLALDQFGARAYADNFTPDELKKSLHEAHLRGVKLYVTVNILTRQSEIDELVEEVGALYDEGLDGVIVQDLGVVTRLKERCPDLLLHASTQMSVSSPEGAAYLKRMGISRVVPARELSLEEMKALKEEAGVEVESFIHGAMCYSYSGRCLMSSFLGGRSGNRGRCAGPCRQPYTILDGNGRPAGSDGLCYPLSMKDLAALPILPGLIEAGIDSFKIEGRMKKPEYAAGVTAIYRKYIDRYLELSAAGRQADWSIDPADQEQLLSLYIRTDLSTGYYHERNGRDLVTIGKGGYSGADEELLAGIRGRYLQGLKKLPVTARARVRAGQEAVLSLKASVGGQPVDFTAGTGLVQRASHRPLTEADIRDKLSRTGDSPFVFSELTIDTDGQSFLPVSALNQLRRDALAGLSYRLMEGDFRRRRTLTPAERTQVPSAYAKRAAQRALSLQTIREKMQNRRLMRTSGFPDRADRAGNPGDPAHRSLTRRRQLMVLTTTAEQLNAVLEHPEPVDILIVDGRPVDGERERILELSSRGAAGNGPRIYIALPHVFRASDRNWMDDILRAFGDAVSGFFVRNMEELDILREKAYDGTVAADACLYHWNQEAANVILSDCDMAVLPLELNLKELGTTFREGLKDREILMVYGAAPMMMTAGCVRKTVHACAHREEDFWSLEDRTRVRFPVRTVCGHCGNIIYNSVPVSIHKFYQDEIFAQTGQFLCAFTNENGRQCKDVVTGFRTLLDAPFDSAACRAAMDRLGRALYAGFTNGHARKGAL